LCSLVITMGITEFSKQQRPTDTWCKDIRVIFAVNITMVRNIIVAWGF
jgi:hypothetical protein